jgi:hypothetical protein
MRVAYALAVVLFFAAGPSEADPLVPAVVAQQQGVLAATAVAATVASGVIAAATVTKRLRKK